MSGEVRQAGRSSQEKYDDLTRAWRRRNRKALFAVGGICAAALGASVVAALTWPSIAWVCGFFGGSAFCFWMVARWSPPGWIENWQAGAWGEEATAKVLAPLENEGWIVLHDLPARRGDIDHLVVGREGVFLLDSKRLGGSVTVSEGKATVRRFNDPTIDYSHPGVGHLMNLARRTHDLVFAESRLRIWVAPVMVLWPTSRSRQLKTGAPSCTATSLHRGCARSRSGLPKKGFSRSRMSFVVLGSHSIHRDWLT